MLNTLRRTHVKSEKRIARTNRVRTITMGIGIRIMIGRRCFDDMTVNNASDSFVLLYHCYYYCCYAQMSNTSVSVFNKIVLQARVLFEKNYKNHFNDKNIGKKIHIAIRLS